jgi:hypothetical protein
VLRAKKTQAREAVSDKSVMGAITSPINSSDSTSGASPSSLLHSATQAPHRPTPQDTAVLSVQAIQFGETNALAGHSFSTTPLTAASAAPAAASSSPAASVTSPSRESTPQQQMAQPPTDAIRALYSNQTKAPPVFSVLA